MIHVYTAEQTFKVPEADGFLMHDDGDLTVTNTAGRMVAGFARGRWDAVEIIKETEK